MHSYCTIEFDEDIPIKSSTWTPDTGVESITGVTVTLRDADMRTVNAIASVSATGFLTPSSAPLAWFNFGPSRLGISNRTETYSLEFKATDTSGFMFASLIGVKVKQAGS